MAILGSSFPSLAKRLLPAYPSRKRLAAVAGCALLAAGCGGGGPTKATPGHLVRASGYRFSIPVGWRVTRTTRTVRAQRAEAIVAVTTFPLRRAYEPRLFARVVPELDGLAEQLASAEHGKVRERRTSTIAGRKVRVYEIERESASPERIAFVLDGKREYELFCRLEAGGEEACKLLFASFTLRA